MSDGRRRHSYPRKVLLRTKPSVLGESCNDVIIHHYDFQQAEYDQYRTVK